MRPTHKKYSELREIKQPNTVIYAELDEWYARPPQIRTWVMTPEGFVAYRGLEPFSHLIRQNGQVHCLPIKANPVHHSKDKSFLKARAKLQNFYISKEAFDSQFEAGLLAHEIDLWTERGGVIKFAGTKPLNQLKVERYPAFVFKVEVFAPEYSELDFKVRKATEGKTQLGNTLLNFEHKATTLKSQKETVSIIDNIQPFSEFEANVIQWARDRNIILGGSIDAQIAKLQEEFDELKEALFDHNQHEVRDAIGDMSVVLCIIAAMRGLRLSECQRQAWDGGCYINPVTGLEEKGIKDRKGKMVNGTFVKESK